MMLLLNPQNWAETEHVCLYCLRAYALRHGWLFDI